MEQSVINFAVYEDAVDYAGMAEVTMPDISLLTQSISGAGIAGNIEAVIMGHIDTMSMTMNFRSTTDQTIKLSEVRRHNLDLRVAKQDENSVSGTLDVTREKHVIVAIPKSIKGGKIAPASPTDGSGEYAVRYWATYLNGKLVREIDPINFICNIGGVDYLADVRKALGKD